MLQYWINELCYYSNEWPKLMSTIPDDDTDYFQSVNYQVKAKLTTNLINKHPKNESPPYAMYVYIHK